MKRNHLYAAAAAISLTGSLIGLGVTVPVSAATTSVAASAHSTGHASRVATAQPDATQPAPSNCPKGYTCGYTQEDYKGSEGKLAGDNASLGGIWQSIESVYNNGNSCNVALYHDTNYNPDGGTTTVNRQNGLKDIASVHEALWHHVSSNKWIGCA